ncbi:MAG TPA: PEGA domain-containing protein [Vicinamibacterales bacterium]|nr:PEGA domain-containing protein [Vicinamibacterales bacterium]
MEEDGAPFDSGFDDTGAFRVSPESGAVSLESALRDFGPAAIDDLIPRIRNLAASLDAAHGRDVVHGALHPNKIFVTDERTSLVAGKGAHAPYAAPELLAGRRATPMSDQYSLAAITYEWLFGRPLSQHGDRPIEFRAMPGVDRLALSRAFNRALSSKPDERFASCAAFVDAVAAAVVPELPLLAGVEDFSAEDEPAPALDSENDPAVLAHEFAVEDANVVAPEPTMTSAHFEPEHDEVLLAQDTHPGLDAMDPPLTPAAAVPVAAWSPSASTPPSRTMETPRFGPIALFLALIVGAVFGFAAGYMAKPRALQSAAPETFAPAADVPSATATSAAGATSATDPTGAEAAKSAAAAPLAPVAPVAPARIGRLLVRSTPSGATVTVDGAVKGVTPLALRDLDVGTRNVTIARRGYVPEDRKVSITKARPARTVDVRLAAVAEPAARPSTPATTAKPGVTTGTLAVDSRPIGAAVTINGKASGSTPLLINDLAPGEYRILMSMPGYRNFATTVHVVAGERVRAAASLTAVEQE